MTADHDFGPAVESLLAIHDGRTPRPRPLRSVPPTGRRRRWAWGDMRAVTRRRRLIGALTRITRREDRPCPDCS